jgi:protein transport protein SEC61 subunit gamma-like protein
LKLNIKSKFAEYKRIIKIARKPTAEEFKRVLKITGIGVLLIGVIGFVLQLVLGVLV